jgi:hypothetical protein
VSAGPLRGRADRRQIARVPTLLMPVAWVAAALDGIAVLHLLLCGPSSLAPVNRPCASKRPRRPKPWRANALFSRSLLFRLTNVPHWSTRLLAHPLPTRKRNRPRAATLGPPVSVCKGTRPGHLYGVSAPAYATGWRPGDWMGIIFPSSTILPVGAHASPYHRVVGGPRSGGDLDGVGGMAAAAAFAWLPFCFFCCPV